MRAFLTSAAQESDEKDAGGREEGRKEENYEVYRDIVNFTISRHILLYVAFFPRDGLTAFPLAAHEVCKEWDTEVNESI